MATVAVAIEGGTLDILMAGKAGLVAAVRGEGDLCFSFFEREKLGMATAALHPGPMGVVLEGNSLFIFTKRDNAGGYR